MDTRNDPSKLFLNLVHQFYQSALIFMGAIPNPQTKKQERNLEMARYFIDSLDMLTLKTNGNLTEEEEKVLEKIRGELKLAFVQAQNDEASEKKK